MFVFCLNCLATCFMCLPLIAGAHRELGQVDWLRNYDRAVELAKDSGKPICLLFQEVPGCQGCVNYGQETLSHPLIVDAIEEAFVPLAIFNNKGGHDRDILKRFKEPAWNFQVMRFVDSKGKDIIPRQDHIWDPQSTAVRLDKALKAAGRNAPLYLQSMVMSNQDEFQTASFSMHCFWSGEAKLGGLDGVVTTEAGWIRGREVVKLQYDPKQIDWKSLSTQAHAFGYKTEPYQQAVYRTASKSDQKRHLKHSNLKPLKLNPAQATKVNAALSRRDAAEALRWLSPSQRNALDMN